jgi:hypothetical protein
LIRVLLQINLALQLGHLAFHAFSWEDAAETIYTANFALSLVLHLVDSLLGTKNAPAIFAPLKKFNGYATSPALPQGNPACRIE